jgi:hypothetical protein
MKQISDPRREIFGSGIKHAGSAIPVLVLKITVCKKLTKKHARPGIRIKLILALPVATDPGVKKHRILDPSINNDVGTVHQTYQGDFNF